MNSSAKREKIGKRERYKVKEEIYNWIIEQKQTDRSISGEQLSCEVYLGFQVQVTGQHINRLVREVGLASRRGGVRRKGRCTLSPANSIGVAMFSYLFQALGFGQKVLEGVKDARRCYQEAQGDRKDFPLLKHLDSTIVSRFMSLTVLPLMGIGKLSELDRKGVDLSAININGVNYSYSTLSQFLGQLEWVNAGAYLSQALLPWDRSLKKGEMLIYLDGHGKGYHTRRCMNVGKVTNKNKIMAGTKEVVLQDERGHILAFEEHPIDLHLVHIVLGMCLEFKRPEQKPIAIIDREVNSLELGKSYAKEKIGLITILKKDQYQGVENFCITHTYTENYKGLSVSEAKWVDEKR